MPIQSYSGSVGVAFDNALPLLSPRVQAGSSLPPGLTLNLDRVVGTPQSIGDYTTFFQYVFVAIKISAGGYHSLALKSDGSVIGWGLNNYGQTTPPAGLTGLTTDIAAGTYHSLALKSDGTVVGWGGQTTTPSGLSGVTAIAAGGSQSLALKSDGTVVGWGDNQATPPSGLSGVTAIAAGGSHSLALKSDGTVVGWGFDGNNRATPPAGLTGVTRIAAGTYHSLALKSDGTVVGWGSNNYGELTAPSGLSGVTDIAAGFQVSYALKSDGTVVMWGYDGSGQLEWREPSPFNVPSGLSGVSLLYTGEKHSLALKSDGSVVAWGNNTYGQTDVPELTESASFTIAAGAPIITAGQTASGQVGTAFSKTFSLTDSTNRPVTSWNATGLPAGLSINTTTGAIAGTPQDSGSKTITLTATGPGGTDTETAVISIAVGPPIITAGQSFSGKVGDAFSQTISLDDAADRPADSWAKTSGTIPAGLTLDTATGAITGTPTAKGSFTASFTATGGGGTSSATSVSFTIAEGVPIITAGQTASGKVGTAFSKTFSLTDSANRPVTSWSATGLPAGLAINASTGAITGTPLAGSQGQTTVTLTATGPGGADTETATISISYDAVIDGVVFTGEGSLVPVMKKDALVAFSGAGAALMEAGGSWELYREIAPAFSGVTSWGGSPGVAEPDLVLIDLTRFVWGEFHIARGFTGRAWVFCYTTLNGRITPEPLVQVGVRFLEGWSAERLIYRTAFTAEGRPFDYVSIADGGSVIEDEIIIDEERAYGVYNIWAAEELPPGQVVVHFSVNLRREA